MTEKELELLEIAKFIMKANEDGPYDLRLTGSLMLALRGIEKRNEAHDIDFLITSGTQLCATANDKDLCPVCPDGFFIDYEGNASDCESICMIRLSDKLKIDFLPSYEDVEYFDEIPCGSIYACLEAKHEYAKNDRHAPTIKKHADDIDYIIEHNKDLEDVKDFMEDYKN